MLDRTQPNPGVNAQDDSASLALEGVDFSYPGQARRALSGVSFEIPTGQTVALVGTSGAGKTTTAQLLMRFWDPDGGRITLNGMSEPLLLGRTAAARLRETLAADKG